VRRADDLTNAQTPSPARSDDEDRASLAAALRRVAQGDRDAFEEVYRRTSMKLFGVCLRILPRRAEAEDALQDAYLAVWRKAATFDEGRGTAMTWLITLARNRALDRVRSSASRPTVAVAHAEAIPDPAAGAFATLAASEEERRLALCLDDLDAGDAGFIRRAFFGGETYSDLAGQIGVPLGTMKSRIRRALVRLRSCLA
jgi:RNA polymerase sigma-70 factor (ECF subfamily)